MAEPIAPAPAPDALHRELWQERIQSARRINLLRFSGVSLFFALFLLLGGLLRLPAWTGNLEIFAIFWALTAVIFWTSRRFDSVAGVATLAIALVDVPMVFFLQWATFPTSPSASGVAGFTLGVYVLLLILAALSLENWYIYFTAAVAAVFEVLLQHLADVSVGGMVSTVIVLGIAAATCSFARTRLVELVARVEREMAEQRRAEQALQQAERMASLGTLAAGVAHEINTPLTYVVANLVLITERLAKLAPSPAATPGGFAPQLATIREQIAEIRAANTAMVKDVGARLSGAIRHDFGNAQMFLGYALRKLAEDLSALARNARAAAPAANAGALAEIDELLRQARDGAERVRIIVRDLRTFSRVPEEAVGPVDLWRVLGSSINLASSEIRHRARLTREAAPVPLVMADEGRLAQVFVNLLVNAAQAIPAGTPDRNEIRVVTRTDEAGRAVVEVRDTGSGIPPEIRDRLFDPFFTTKAVGEGTGLGLAICHGIVRNLGGQLSVESERGHGSTFRIVLPAAPSAEVARVASAPAAPVTGRRGRVLLVDDDPGIGQVVRDSLAPEHEVVAMTSASDALERLETGEHFDLILCDLMMPLMTGMAFHEALLRIDPGQAGRIIFLTGGAFTADAQTFLGEIANRQIEKPFDPRQLRSVVLEHL